MRTLWLAVLGVVVLAGGWYFGPGANSGSRLVVPTGTLVFPGLAGKLQAATMVEISNKGKTLRIARGKEFWGLADRGGYKVQQDKLREMLTGLTELRIIEPRTADPAQYDRLGVGDPNGANSTANLLRVLDASGAPMAELITGHRRVRTAGNLPETLYIRRPGEAQSWLAEGRVQVDADPQLWFERDIVNIPLDRVASVVLRRGDAVLNFAKIDGKPALIQVPDQPKLDDYKLEDVFRALAQLTLTDVAEAAKAPGEKIGDAVYTLNDGVRITVTVARADKDIWIQLAAAGDGDAAKPAAALQAGFAGWAFQLGAWKEKSFLPVMDDLKAEEPAKPVTPPSQ
jgi:hypothetical protein